MKRFRFKLATVLKVKSRVEEERQRQLQRAEMKQQEARRQLLQCQEMLTGTMQEYQRRMRERFDRYLAEDYQQYTSWLQQQLQTANLYLQQCEAEVTQARQCLIVATQERKIVDKLRERAYQSYQQAELHAEINFLDELGTGRFIRQETGNAREER